VKSIAKLIILTRLWRES